MGCLDAAARWHGGTGTSYHCKVPMMREGVPAETAQRCYRFRTSCQGQQRPGAKPWPTDDHRGRAFAPHETRRDSLRPLFDML
jgi:hypothetical protein